MNTAFNFSSPRSRIIVHESHTQPQLDRLILTHPFNFELLMLIDQKQDELLLKHLSHKMRTNDQHFHYYMCHASPLDLLSLLDLTQQQQQSNHEFEFFVHSIDAKSESTNQIAIYPNKKNDKSPSSSLPSSSKNQHVIHLQVDKDTYEQLGLEGKLVETYTHHNHHDRLYKSQYRVSVKWPIESLAMKERVIWAFRRLSSAFVLCSVYSKNDGARTSIDISSLFDHLKKSKETTVGAIEELRYKKMAGIGSELQTFEYQIPRYVTERVDHEDGDKSRLNLERIRQMITIVGCAFTGVSLNEMESIADLERQVKQDDESSGDDVDQTRTVVAYKMTGFIPPHLVHDLVSQIQHSYQTRTSNNKEDWSCVLVRGFEDAVVSWNENAHGFGMSGENDYGILFTTNETVSCQMLGQLDQL